MILHLYLAQRFLRAFLLVLGVFCLILVPLDLAEQMRRIVVNGGTLRNASELTILNMPALIYSLFPLLVLLASLVFFLGLARSSELVVIRAAGRSALRASLAPMMAALGIGVFGILVMNPIAASTESRHAQRLAEIRGSELRSVSISPEGLWLRQANDGRQIVIRADRANGEGTQLSDASFFDFDDNGRIGLRINAEFAELRAGAWVMQNAKIWDLSAANPEASAKYQAEYTLPSSLTREQIRDSFGKPSSVPIFALPDFIDDLQAAGFAGLSHRVWLQMELANPLMLAAMVLIGASLTMRHTRFGRTGPLVLAAILLGFGLYFLRSFAQVLGENGQLPVMIVAWAPPLAGVLMALGMILHTEDG